LILKGKMKNAPAKKLGLELAAATSGVRAIVDRLKVARASRTSSFAASNSLFNIAGSVSLPRMIATHACEIQGAPHTPVATTAPRLSFGCFTDFTGRYSTVRWVISRNSSSAPPAR
jgi:hypothetical protein